MPAAKIVALDFDDTCVDTLDHFVEFINVTYGLNLKPEDYVNDEFWVIWNVDREEAVRRTFAFHLSEYQKRIRPIEGVREALKDLLQVLNEDMEDDDWAELHVVTARPAHLHDETPAVVHEFFPGIFSGIHFANTWDTRFPILKKSEVCARIGAKRIVDDTHRHAHDCAEAGMDVFLIDFHWNRHVVELHPNIRRIHHLRDVVAHLRVRR